MIQQNRLQRPYLLKFQIYTYHHGAARNEQVHVVHKWKEEVPNIPREMDLLLNVRPMDSDRYRLQLVIIDYNGFALICYRAIVLTNYGVVNTALPKAQNTFKMHYDDGRVQDTDDD